MLQIAKIYVDSSASSHMTNHGKWFSDVRNLEKLGYVEIGDDTAHPIAQVGKVPLAMQDGRIKYLSDVLHILNIIKNLVLVGQMVEQGLQVRFNRDGCFVENLKNQCHLVAKGKRNGKMFTLDVDIPEVQAAMFVHGRGVITDIEIWHKRIGHVNTKAEIYANTEYYCKFAKIQSGWNAKVWRFRKTSPKLEPPQV